MEMLQELLLTGSLSLFLAFLFSRVVSTAVALKAPMAVRSPPPPPPPPAEVEKREPPHAAAEEEVEESGAVEVDVVDRRTVEVSPEEVAEKEVEGKEVAVEEVEGEGEGKERELWLEEEEWEGVERSELERVFGAAVAFANSAAGTGELSRVGGDVQMRLYGLQKVAMEGPCYENQPIALKVSARSRWHAWQKLGNMDREAAMEQYVTLLSDKVHGWTEGRASAEGECAEGRISLDAGVSELVTSERGMSPVESERKLDIN